MEWTDPSTPLSLLEFSYKQASTKDQRRGRILQCSVLTLYDVRIAVHAKGRTRRRRKARPLGSSGRFNTDVLLRVRNADVDVGMASIAQLLQWNSVSCSVARWEWRLVSFSWIILMALRSTSSGRKAPVVSTVKRKRSCFWRTETSSGTPS